MTTASLHTPLYAWHVAAGGKMVDFAGWQMPVVYTSILAEHQATRSALALFDVSHMGRLSITGPQAETFLDAVLTRRVTSMKSGQIRYSLICREDGGTLDDVLVYRLPERHAEAAAPHPAWQLVVNASNREKIIAWLEKQRQAHAFDARLDDQTTVTAMIAVQGPRAVEYASRLLEIDVSAIPYYGGCWARHDAADVFVSRTGYTGEDGCELICDRDVAETLWKAVLEAARPAGALAAGLGARDTLRLEAGMPLYGHELSEQITPIQAGLKFACNLEGREFVGRAALVKACENPKLPRLIGLKLAGKRVARETYAVWDGEHEVGSVTSGTFSPTLDIPIAMAYVDPAAADRGRELAVDIRGRRAEADVIHLPFYKRNSA